MRRYSNPPPNCIFFFNCVAILKVQPLPDLAQVGLCSGGPSLVRSVRAVADKLSGTQSRLSQSLYTHLEGVAVQLLDQQAPATEPRLLQDCLSCIEVVVQFRKKEIYVVKFSDGECPSWTCIGTDSADLVVPRVKLTGNGKMPVADMRSVNNIQISDQNGHSR